MELHDGDIIVFKDTINISDLPINTEYYLNFASSSTNYGFFYNTSQANGKVLYYGSRGTQGSVVYEERFGWRSVSYKTITISGDQTVENETLINWLYENVESGLPDPPGPGPDPDSKYKITEISFSLFTDMESGSRVTTLKAHISYEFLGFNNTKEYGTAVAEIADVCSVTFDADGKAQTITTESMPDRDTILSAVTDAVEADIKDVTIRAQEDSFKRSYLGKISKGYDDNGTLVPWESRFTPQPPPTYPELEDMNTGIGAVGYNEIFNN